MRDLITTVMEILAFLLVAAGVGAIVAGLTPAGFGLGAAGLTLLGESVLVTVAGRRGEG